MRFMVYPLITLHRSRKNVLVQDDQVFNAIIERVSVDVVNVLEWKKFPPDHLLHNPAMFTDLLAVAMN